MSKGNVPVYTMADYERLKAAQEGLQQVGQLLDKGERCGVNCSTARAIRNQMEKELNAIEVEFMSNPAELS
jgi:hypothetical protein